MNYRLRFVMLHSLEGQLFLNLDFVLLVREVFLVPYDTVVPLCLARLVSEHGGRGNDRQN